MATVPHSSNKRGPSWNTVTYTTFHHHICHRKPKLSFIIYNKGYILHYSAFSYPVVTYKLPELDAIPPSQATLPLLAPATIQTIKSIAELSDAPLTSAVYIFLS